MKRICHDETGRITEIPDDAPIPRRWAEIPQEQQRAAPDKTIRELQTSLPWTIRYSRDYRAAPTTHKDFAHALHHVAKAAGKLHALADDMDHDREVADDPTLRERHAKYIADLVVCALRLANVFPGGVVDLQRAVEDRIVEKNARSDRTTCGNFATRDIVSTRYIDAGQGRPLPLRDEQIEAAADDDG